MHVGIHRNRRRTPTVEHLSPHHDGLTIRLPSSKTDQTGAGRAFLLAYGQTPNPCPVRAVRAWIDYAGLTSGPLARRVTRTGTVSSPLSSQSVALIIKRRTHAAGLEPPRLRRALAALGVLDPGRSRRLPPRPDRRRTDAAGVTA